MKPAPRKTLRMPLPEWGMSITVKFDHWLPKILGVGAIVLYPYMLIRTRSDVTSKQLMIHERMHLEQIHRYGVVRFYLKYLFDYGRNLIRYRSHRRAYLEIPFEIEAREAERQVEI